MRHWKSGEFERERLSVLFRSFAPAHAADCLEEIDLHDLWDEGKRLLLLDVDHTIVQWRQESFKPSVLEWLERAKQLGFDICIISNTRRVARLQRIKEMLAVETVRGRFKPSRAMYRLALIKFGRKPHEAVMIGDQMMTDILGANRAGIDAIWVRKMEGKEFGPTKINRFVERLLTSAIYKVLVLPEGSRAPGVSDADVKELTGAQQAFRFVIVGGSSFAIDFGLTYFLMKFIHVDGQEMGITFGTWLQSHFGALFASATSPDKAAAPILKGVASFFAMFNSFVWNRAWTFEAKGKGPRTTQITRFYAVAITGNFIGLALFGVFYGLFPGKQILLSNALAAIIAAVWNFFGQRYFAFRGRGE